MRVITEGGTASPDEIRRLYGELHLSQRAAAKALQINEDDFRKMCAAKIPAPICLIYAMRYLKEHPLDSVANSG